MKKQPEYLEIYPSEVAAKKISKHLDRMLETKPRVYRKTLVRYKKLAYLLIECATKIIKLLQSESLLSSENTEFQELITDFDLGQVGDLRDSLEDLNGLVDKNPTHESKSSAAIAINAYKDAFKQATSIDFGFQEVNDCAELLNYWTMHRFSGLNPNFRFQVKQLPIWSTFIVVAYGKYHSEGRSLQFIEEFRAWCDSLATDSSNCWALPYNVFNMTKTIDSKNFTLDALIIYDILMDGCLYLLADAPVPMDGAYVAKLLKEYRPDLQHDVRTRYARQSELISQIYLHATIPAESSDGQTI